MIEDNTFVVQGTSAAKRISDRSIGKLMYDQLLSCCNENEDNEAMVS
jgi:hypothetical protein